MAKASVMAIILGLLWCQLSQAEDVGTQPYDLTSRGVIASDAGQRYRTALNECYKGQPGNAPSGPEFLACLRKQVHVGSATLEEIYKGTLEYLKNHSEQSVRLRQSQKAWLQFRDANCAFAKSVSPKRQGEEFFYDCLLRSIVDRQAELQSLVGD